MKISTITTITTIFATQVAGQVYESLADAAGIECIDGTPLCMEVTQPTPGTAQFALLAESSVGWGSIGFGNGRQMPDTTVFVVYNVNGQTVVSQRTATSRSEPKAVSSQDITLVDSGTLDGKFGAVWTLDVEGAQNIRPLDLESQEQLYIYAWSNTAPSSSELDASIGIHETTGAFTASGDVQSGLVQNIVIHGALMIAAWAFLTPAGIFVARYLKPKLGVWWFRLHYIFMLLVVVFSFVAFAFAYLQAEGRHFSQGVHAWFGLAVLVLSVVQAVLGFVIDKLFDPKRKGIPWHDKAHWWTGRFLGIFTLVTIALGILLAGAGVEWWVGFAVVAIVSYGALIGGQVKFGQQHHEEK